MFHFINSYCNKILKLWKKKEWKEVTKKVIQSFPPDTSTNGCFEDKVIVKLLMRFYCALN